MDSKIKVKGERLKLKGLALCATLLVLLASCKTNNWAEWKVQNELWLENNKNQPGVVVTESGLQYKIIADPTPQDAQPNTTSTIRCDYSVRLINGYVLETYPNASISLSSTC